MFSVKRPIRWPIIAPLCSDNATIAGNIEGPHKSKQISASIYSGVDRVITRITCQMQRPKVPKNSGEIRGNISNVRKPDPTSAI